MFGQTENEHEAFCTLWRYVILCTVFLKTRSGNPNHADTKLPFNTYGGRGHGQNK